MPSSFLKWFCGTTALFGLAGECVLTSRLASDHLLVPAFCLWVMGWGGVGAHIRCGSGGIPCAGTSLDPEAHGRVCLRLVATMHTDWEGGTRWSVRGWKRQEARAGAGWRKPCLRVSFPGPVVGHLVKVLHSQQVAEPGCSEVVACRLELHAG